MTEYTKRRNKNRGYMKLEVWQKGLELFKLVWKITSRGGIDFKLRSQLVDAAQSVSSNIAEGYGRRSIKEYIQFLYVALGSLAEVLTRCIGLREIGLISPDDLEQIDTLHYEVENKLLNLVGSLEHKRDSGGWVDAVSENVADYQT
ncbi:MAG: four helix bundle protein [Bacteroidota bacterium]